MGKLSGKIGVMMGVANDRSLAWAISQALYAEGAELVFTYLPGPSNERRVKKLLGPFQPKLLLPCDVQNDDDITAVFRTVGKTYGRIDMLLHSIAFAPPAELKKPYVQTSREGFHRAMDISVYSLVSACRAASAWMPPGGTILTITYFGAEKVMPGYNLMGVCKAALEHSVRYLAWDLGREKQIRVNALSAGPMRTLSSAGLAEFDQMLRHAARKACLNRNIEFEEIGATGLYLLSDASSGVTGEIVHVDAGYNIVGL
ncbi:MAG TPA: enoyl-ACP reductase [Thermoguttaceae bacterium]|nr:enoyl-ACP reductase [Thermoguttaceae bacterium]